MSNSLELNDVVLYIQIEMLLLMYMSCHQRGTIQSNACFDVVADTVDKSTCNQQETVQLKKASCPKKARL